MGGPPEPTSLVAAPPVLFFRGNEFDIGVFATYVTGTNGSESRTRTFANGDYPCGCICPIWIY